MKDRFISTILTLIICVIITVTVLFSLDLCGIITLPENMSLKTYMSGTIQVSKKNEDIYYPDYIGTGYQNLVTSAQDSSTSNSTSNSSSSIGGLEEIISASNTTTAVQSEASNVSASNYENITDNSYYYNQLDEYGKIIYSRLYSNLENLKSGLYTVDYGITFNELLQTAGGETTLTNSFQLAINALLLDHPSIFYLNVTKMFMFTESTTTIKGTTYRISIGPDEGKSYLADGFENYDDVVNAEANVKYVSDYIRSTLSGDLYNQIKQVHDFLIDYIQYDSESNSEISHGVYGALINRLAVCDGYAKVFKYILDDMGVVCIEVCGTGQNSSGATENHAWNDVLLNGNWYAVDVTWDDPIIIGGNGKLTDDLRYRYFLKGSNEFYQAHQEDGYIVSNGKFEYPILSSTNY